MVGGRGSFLGTTTLIKSHQRYFDLRVGRGITLKNQSLLPLLDLSLSGSRGKGANHGFPVEAYNLSV